MPGPARDEEHAFQCRSYLDSAARWRREAENLRDHAALPRLAPEASATLLRNAEWAEQTALYWEAGAEDYRS